MEGLRPIAAVKLKLRRVMCLKRCPKKNEPEDLAKKSTKKITSFTLNCWGLNNLPEPARDEFEETSTL